MWLPIHHVSLTKTKEIIYYERNSGHQNAKLALKMISKNNKTKTNIIFNEIW